MALTADAGRIRTGGGSLLTYYRRPLTAAVPLWELAAERSRLVVEDFNFVQPKRSCDDPT